MGKHSSAEELAWLTSQVCKPLQPLVEETPAYNDAFASAADDLSNLVAVTTLKVPTNGAEPTVWDEAANDGFHWDPLDWEH